MATDYGTLAVNNKSVAISSSSIYHAGGGKTLSDILYPVGAVYISINSTNPSNYYGGKWELLCPGCTLVCIDTDDSDFNYAMKQGGSKTHTLSANEIPSHNHYPSDAGANWVPAFNNFGRMRVAASSSNDIIIPSGNNGYDSWKWGGTSFVGGDKPHNNLQPYMVVYMWVRIS